MGNFIQILQKYKYKNIDTGVSVFELLVICRLTKAGNLEEAGKTLSIIESKLNYMFGYDLLFSTLFSVVGSIGIGRKLHIKTPFYLVDW